MRARNYLLMVSLLFTVGLGIGTSWQRRAAAGSVPDYAAIMALACAPSSTGVPHPGLHKHERYADTVAPIQTPVSLP